MSAPPWAPYAGGYAATAAPAYQVPPQFGSPPPHGYLAQQYGAGDNNGFPAGQNEYTNYPSVADSFVRSQQTARNYYNGMVYNAPQFALNQNSRESILNQIAATQGQYGIDKDYLVGTNANSLAQLGLKQQGLGIDQAAIGRKGEYLTHLHDIAGQVFDLQGKEAWQQAGKEQRSTRSAAIASGANTSIGLNQSMTDIANDLTNRGQEIDLSRQRETTQFNEDFAANTDNGKQLDLQAQSLGIDRDQLALNLQHGLDQLGLSNSFSLADLFGKMQSTSIQDAILANQLFWAAYNASDAHQTSPANGTSGSSSSSGGGGGNKIR